MDQIHIAQGVAGNKPKRDDGILGHFETWWEAEFKTELLPVIPHGATISPRSKIKEGGKTPGLKTNDGWTGFPNWPAYQFEYKDVKTCGDMGANVGLQLRQFKAADLDVNNEELAKTIEEIAIHTLGDAPVRTRPNSSRRLLLYRGKGFRTRRVRFMDANGNSHTVELLGEHQDPERATQCVVEGITKSGKLKWRNWHPCERGGANGLTELTPEHVNAFFGELISTLDMLGCTIIPHGEGSSTAQPRKPFDAPGMAAPSPEHVKKALKHLENTYKNFPERGDFVAVGAAIYASYGPDREQYYLDFEEWAIEGYPENTPEFVRQVWDSFAKGVSIGWDWLSGLARGKGYEDDSAQEDFKDDPPPEYMPPPDPLAEYLPYPLPERAKPKRSIPVIRVDYDEPLPMRQFLYGKHYARKYLSSTIAPGGLGKSTLLTAETTAMGAGKSLLLGEPATPPLRTWYINGEDDEEEIKRKFMAVARYHGLTNEDIGGRLLVNSGRSYNFVVAVGGRGSIEIKEEVVAAIKDYIKSNGIDVVIIDPFVAFHGVSENDNQQINTVCRVWRGIAEECNCAVELVHHTRKFSGSQTEASADDGRGASALGDATRSVRVLNVMSKDEAARFGIEEQDRHDYFRADNGKTNLKRKGGGSKWFRLHSQQLGNGDPIPHAGDDVGVVTSWEPSAADENLLPEEREAVFAGVGDDRWRASPQADDWIGRPIATALGIDLDIPAVKAKVKALIKSWLKDGTLVEIRERDGGSKLRPFIKLGPKIKPQGISAAA